MKLFLSLAWAIPYLMVTLFDNEEKAKNIKVTDAGSGEWDEILTKK